MVGVTGPSSAASHQPGFHELILAARLVSIIASNHLYKNKLPVYVHTVDGVLVLQVDGQ